MPRRAAALLRVAWALVSVFVLESLVFGLSVLPAVLFWEWHFRWELDSAPLRVVFLSVAFTAPVRLARGVTVGIGSVVGIGVVAGDRCQIGALSLVPKFAELEEGAVYVGIPVRRMEPR